MSYLSGRIALACMIHAFVVNLTHIIRIAVGALSTLTTRALESLRAHHLTAGQFGENIGGDKVEDNRVDKHGAEAGLPRHEETLGAGRDGEKNTRGENNKEKSQEEQGHFYIKRRPYSYKTELRGNPNLVHTSVFPRSAHPLTQDWPPRQSWQFQDSPGGLGIPQNNEAHTSAPNKKQRHGQAQPRGLSGTT